MMPPGIFILTLLGATLLLLSNFMLNILDTDLIFFLNTRLVFSWLREAPAHLRDLVS
jgi:hypothetical protein